MNQPPQNFLAGSEKTPSPATENHPFRPALNDVHQQFAEFFHSPSLKPYAYLVSKKLSEGHICIHLNDLQAEADFPYPGLELHQWQHLKEEPQVAAPDGRQPFVLHNDRLYLHRYFTYETAIINRIRTFLQSEAAVEKERLQKLEEISSFIQTLFAPAGKREEGQPTDWQLVAALCGLINNFTIITGGPGTGKTTTVAKILAILYHLHPSLKVALAAPTGKAAARMAESLKKARLPVEESITQKFGALEPATIHRLLQNIGGTIRFRHNRDNPLPFDVVIVDESSMLDVSLFARLLEAIGPQTRLLLLGDKDQLASVEAGSLFGDLCLAQEKLNVFSPERAALINRFLPDGCPPVPVCESAEASAHALFQHVVELRYSHRFTGDAGIGRFSKAIIQNDPERIGPFLKENSDEEVVIDAAYTAKLFEDFICGYESFIREKDIRLALQRLNDLRVLCAIREGEQGLYALNRKIENYLRSKRLISLTGEFYEHRPVMVTRNHYHLGLFNGDTGILRFDEKGVLKAWFEDSKGELKAVSPGYLSQCETVFAMTIHKSQGSEFNRVLVVLPQLADIPILTRELLYTGVTRAKKKVFVQATEAGLLHCARGKVQRGSGIHGRFKDE